MTSIEQIYKDNIQSLYRYAYAHVGIKEDAEDITAETFTRFSGGVVIIH